MRAFIVRPFGVKSDIDFERVERELIGPALDAVGSTGRTTGEILKQGNIRTDMFQRLLTADLVVADVSIHNANVFYELGIRHSLREKRTFLLRCEGDKYPFDLQTDRYFVYDKDNPAASLAPLITALKRTLASGDQDSPVFRSLPDLREQDRSLFLVVPRGFREEVERAGKGRYLGDVELLASEARGFEWETEGLRLVGRAQFDCKAWRGARDTWKAVREIYEQDLEANLRLATVYERLGDLVASEQAVKRVLDCATAPAKDRAEALSLAARNAKRRWQAEWERLSEDHRREAALRSRYLMDTLDAYAEAFREDVNHFYPGLNALAMLRILVELATAHPTVWEDAFDDPEQAAPQLAARKRQAGELAGAVKVSLDAERARLERARKTDIWVDISEADFALLTSTRPTRVADAYRKALVQAPDFAEEAARKQILIYEQLGIMKENVTAALIAFKPPAPPRPEAERGRVLLFTGHMIDAADRKEPRFPADKEAVAREAIRKAVEAEREICPIDLGIAGGASGGDILFHEVCAEMGIPTRIYLALPAEKYVVESVQAAGPGWVERFYQLCQKHTDERVLAESKELPNWLIDREGEYDIWSRNSLWMLHNALAERATDVTLIALWNGRKGDGPGGTADLVQQARERGAKVILLDTRKLFGLPD